MAPEPVWMGPTAALDGPKATLDGPHSRSAQDPEPLWMGPIVSLDDRREEISHRRQCTTADPACSTIITVCTNLLHMKAPDGHCQEHEGAALAALRRV